MTKILVVDDSAFARRMICRQLEEIGHEAVEADGGPDVLAKYPTVKPDVVFLDLLMPGMAGTEALDRLKALDDKVRVIVCSSNVQQSARAEMVERGAVDYLTKPPKLPEIRAAIEKALKRESDDTSVD